MKESDRPLWGIGREGARVPNERRGSNLNLRKVAAALYGIPGCDATPEQLEKARKAVEYHRQGKSVSLIRLLLRIKAPAAAPARLPLDRVEDDLVDLAPETISLDPTT